MLENKSWFLPLATKMNSSTKIIIILQMRNLRYNKGLGLIEAPQLLGGKVQT